MILARVLIETKFNCSFIQQKIMGHLYARHCARFWGSKYILKNIFTSKELALILELDEPVPAMK